MKGQISLLLVTARRS